MIKRHIARSKSVTFCGYSYTIWRLGKRNGWPKATFPLYTADYDRATCKTCKNAFESLASNLQKGNNFQQLEKLVKIFTEVHEKGEV